MTVIIEKPNLLTRAYDKLQTWFPKDKFLKKYRCRVVGHNFTYWLFYYNAKKLRSHTRKHYKKCTSCLREFPHD